MVCAWMKLGKLWIVVLLCLALAQIGHARLGDTEKELVARFGAVQMRGRDLTSFESRTYVVGTTLHFKMDQWSISAVMIDGRCARITYGKPGSWTEEQVATVFNANGAMANWKADRENAPLIMRSWRRNDGATAQWSLAGLQLTHPAYERHLAMLKAKAEADSHRPPKL
jgi:hypothetical protein